MDRIVVRDEPKLRFDEFWWLIILSATSPRQRGDLARYEQIVPLVAGEVARNEREGVVRIVNCLGDSEALADCD